MGQKQNTTQGIIIGIDIGKYDVQVSCLPFNENQAETISTQMGSDNYEIPLCLFKKSDATNWQYGHKAKEYMYSKKGLYVEDLWEGMLGKREIILEDGKLTYTELMSIYVEKLLLLVSQSGYLGEIAALVFTASEMDCHKIKCLRSVVAGLDTPIAQAYFLEHKECFGAYATNTTKDLWNHDVFLFHYAGRKMKAYQLRVNQKTLPFKMMIGEMDFDELEYGREELEESPAAREEMDNRFTETIEEVFARKIVSSVYLIGDGFLADWMKNSLHVLCRGRRVFQGNNLFTKGACYAARWYLGIVKPAGEYQSSQMLPCDVRIPVVQQDGSNGVLYGSRRGDLWYYAGCKVECLIEELQISDSENSHGYEAGIEIVSTLSNGEMVCRMESLPLEDFPKRPGKASRVQILMDFLNPQTGRIVVKDLGFGEFYPSSGLCREKQFSLVVKADKEETGYE